MMNSNNKSGCKNTKIALLAVTAIVIAGITYKYATGGDSRFYKDSPVVAKVNGKAVYQIEADNIVKAVIPANEKQVSYKDLDEKSKNMIIREIAAQRAMLKEADKKDITKDADLQRKIHEISNKLTLDKFLEKFVTPEVTPEKLQAKYDDIEKNIKGKPQIKASHILVSTEAQANDVIERLKKDSFAKVAKDVSLDTANKDHGGELGYLLSGTMDPDFEKAALALKAGETSEPVKTKFGWHIIKIDERKIASVAPFEALKQRIAQDLYNEALKKYADELLKDAKIELVASEEAKKDEKKEEVKKEEEPKKEEAKKAENVEKATEKKKEASPANAKEEKKAKKEADKR